MSPKRLDTSLSFSTYFLSTAKTAHVVARKGAVFQIVDASSPSATISVAINDGSSVYVPMRRGDFISAPFDRVYITNSVQEGQWLKVLIGTDREDRFNFSDYMTSFDGLPRVQTRILVTDTLSSVISPTKEVSQFVLLNDQDSADPLYIGDALLAPSSTKIGDLILPTERRVFRGVNSSFNIYARCKTGQTATLGVIEYD